MQQISKKGQLLSVRRTFLQQLDYFEPEHELVQTLGIRYSHPTNAGFRSVRELQSRPPTRIKNSVALGGTDA